MKLTRQTHLQLSIQKIIFLLLFLSGIGMLAWISNHYTMQFDLTANKRHSLSSESIRLLHSLDKPVTVHAYTTDEVTRKAVSEIIVRYQRVKKDFKLRLLNPDIDITQAQQDGIIMDQPYAFVIRYNERMEQITSLSEQSISNALLRLNRRDNQQIVFLSGHGEREIIDKNGTSKRAYHELNKQLMETGIKPESINLAEESLPDKTWLLVIASPATDYTAAETEQIMRYVDNGGNLLWLLDPVKTSANKPDSDNLNGLKNLATSLGLQIQDGIVIDYNTDLRKTLNIEHPAIIPVTEYFPHAITNNIRYNTLFPVARGISLLTGKETTNDWQVDVLFNSLARSWSEMDSLTDEMVYQAESGDIAGPITLAVALHRNLETSTGTTSSSGREQRIVVAGDSDFLSDAYIGAGANLSLGLNIFNWLASDDDLISVETKSSPDIRLVLSDTQLLIIGFGFFLILPALLLVAGFMIWHKRKKL